MVLCEQFIFATANLNDKTGYQVIAKSSNITTELLSKLEDYMYPIGVEPSNFSNSKSLLILNNVVAYTIVKNVGLGHDGRFNNMRSHTIIININDFKKFDNDTRCFEQSYNIHNTSEHLPPLSIAPIKFEPNFDCVDIIGISQFEYFFKLIFDKKRIVIQNKITEDIIPDLLSLLPPSHRLNSFSTLVIKEDRQPEFNIIKTDKTIPLSKKYYSIESKNNETRIKNKNSLYHLGISHLMKLINSKNSSYISKIYDNFEKISFLMDKEKLFLAIVISIPIPKNMYDINDNLDDFLFILEKLPLDFMRKHFKKIQVLLPNEVADIYSDKIICESELVNSHYGITYGIISNIFDKLKKDESRLSFFRNLVLENMEYMKKSSSNILLNSIGKKYNHIIMNGFLENDILHKHIIHVLIRLNSNDKKYLFNYILDESLTTKIFSLEKLFEPSIFNLSYNLELSYYRDSIQKLFTSYLFYEKSDSKTITYTIKQIYDKWIKFSKINHSYNNDKREIILNILYAISNITNYLILERKINTNDLKKIHSDIKNDLLFFHKTNMAPMNDMKYQYNNIFKLIPPIFLKYFFNH